MINSLNNALVTIAQPYLAQLSEQISESVALEHLTGTNITLASHVEGRRHIRFSFRPGEQVPINVWNALRSARRPEPKPYWPSVRPNLWINV